MADRASGTPFGDVLRRTAAAEPDRPALTSGTATVSRQEVVQWVSQLARRMAELGVGADSTVTIGLPNSVEFIVTMFAAWELGAVPQPISHRLPAVERIAIVELAEPALVVGLPVDEAAGRPSLSLDDIQAARADGTRTLDSTNAGIASAWKIVTSGGSTGRPKLIVATQPAVFEAIAPFAGALRFPSDGAVLVTGPLSHNAPFVVAAIGLLTGNHVVVMPRFDATETLRLVEQYRIEWLYLVPTMMLRIWRLPEEERSAWDVSSLAIAFHMAAPCPPWLKREWIDWLGPDKVLELYGGTELQAMTIITGREWLDHPGSVGPPVIGEIEVRDPDGNQLPAGQVGELWMRRGPDAASPYRYVGATAKGASEGWESLGDMGSMDDEGYVYLTDRDTDMVVVGGSNVYPAEVEAALDEHPAVRSSCVIGLPDDDLGNAPHAIVELAAGIEVTDDDLRSFLRERLAPYKVPRSFERVDEPLRDDAGKVRRSALRSARIEGKN